MPTEHQVRRFFCCPKQGKGKAGMTRQTKNVSLQEYKALDDTTAGGFSAYATIFGELDDTGDIILPGAYKDTIPQFLEHGFIARSHDWSTAIGMPKGAREDKRGLIIDAAYHSTPEAQAQRTITNERIAAGLSARVSIGYDVPPGTPILVRAQDYATELPKYSASDLIQQNLAKAQRFPEVRILPQVNLYELSQVQVPALASAMVTGAKSADAQDDVSDGLVDGPLLTYTAHLSTVVDAVKAIAGRTEARAALRVKEGRVLSSANWSELQELYDRLGKLLDAAKPRPKDEQETDDGEKSALAQEVNALLHEHYARQQSLRALQIHRS